MKYLKFYLVVFLVFVWVEPVLAYIDPASGSAIMSAIIGFIVAVGLAIKTYWYKLKSLFMKKRDINSNDKDE